MSYVIRCDQGQCPPMHWCDSSQICQHSLFPLSFGAIVGSFIVSFIAGISTLAGLGGGGPMISFLILLFYYSPKVSTLLVYCLILGGTLGNVANQASTLVNGRPMIIYRYCFVSIPFMFGGSLVGVLINKYFPSAAVVGLIIVTTVSSLKSIYARFKVSYQKESEQNQEHQEGVHKPPEVLIQRFNVFESAQNQMLFKRLLLLMAVFILLQMVRGSERFGSIVGIEACSFSYWMVEILIFVVVYVFGKWHISVIRSLQEKEVMLVDGNNRSEPLNDASIANIIKGSVLGGLYSGFGLGGGLFLVPMYKNQGLNPLQATASTSFNILITASINTLQAVFIGAIHFDELLYFILLTALGSFVLSTLISRQLQRRNRLSMVELMLVLLLALSVFNIPYGMIRRYIQSGYDSQVIFGFGRLC